MAIQPSLFTDNSLKNKIQCMITQGNNITVKISKSIDFNNIVIERYDDKSEHVEDCFSIEIKDARIQAVAKSYYQYMSQSWNFPYYDAKADRYGRENKDSETFKRTARICRGIFDAKLGISPSVFTGISSVPVKKGYENRVTDGVNSILITFNKIKNGEISLVDFKNGDPVFELCLFLAKRKIKSRGNDIRRITARITCAFWDAYLLDGKLENINRVAMSCTFTPLKCCPAQDI